MTNDQFAKLLEVVAVETEPKSIFQVTEARPVPISDPVPLTANEEVASIAEFAGDEIVRLGEVLSTVNVACEMFVFPALSVALAITECGPSERL